MTKEEAIKILKECRESKLKYTFITLNEYQAATDMAIQALEQQDKTEKLLSVGVLKDCESCKAQKPCTDAISRQAVIDAIEKTKSAMTTDGEIYVAKINAEMNIQQLSSVSTEKTGRWEKHSYFKDAYICSVCNTGGNMVYKDFKYCPNCGAKMEVEE